VLSGILGAFHLTAVDDSCPVGVSEPIVYRDRTWSVTGPAFTPPDRSGSNIGACPSSTRRLQPTSTPPVSRWSPMTGSGRHDSRG
jgi:hypothetical protein